MTTPDNPYGQPTGQPQQPPPPGYSGPPSYQSPPAYGAPQPGYQPQGYGGFGAPSGAPMKNGLGVAALVLGLLSIPVGLFVVGAVLGVLAVIFGFIGRGRFKRGEANNGGIALAGIITGVVGILIAIGALVVYIAVYNSSSFKNLQDCLASANGDQVKVQQCNNQFSKSITGN